MRSYYGLRAIGGTDPWRQMVLLTLAAAVFLSSNPQAAYAETPTYDPVFYYYHPDHLGSAQLETSRAGEVVQHYGYSPYGSERYRANNDAFSVSNRYTGQTLDEDTGLYYYGARYYDPEVARFIQADSTIPDPEFSQAYNRYAYVYNNPLKFSDPTGQEPFSIAFMLISMAISGGMSAATGGNIIKGMILGAISYAVGFGAGQLVGNFEVCGWALIPTGSAIAGAAISGAVTSMMSGGDPLTSAIAAGVAAGIQSGFSPQPSASDSLSGEYLKELVRSTAIGALAGGVAAEISGGDFGQGAAYGAAGAAAGHLLRGVMTKWLEGSQMKQGIGGIADPVDIDLDRIIAAQQPMPPLDVCAEDAMQQYIDKSVSQGVEYAMCVFEDTTTGKFYHPDVPFRGERLGFDVGKAIYHQKGWMESYASQNGLDFSRMKLVAITHSHPHSGIIFVGRTPRWAHPNRFSPADIAAGRSRGLHIYAMTPKKNSLHYDPTKPK